MYERCATCLLKIEKVPDLLRQDVRGGQAKSVKVQVQWIHSGLPEVPHEPDPIIMEKKRVVSRTRGKGATLECGHTTRSKAQFSTSCVSCWGEQIDRARERIMGHK
jgi:hypothetical protein